MCSHFGFELDFPSGVWLRHQPGVSAPVFWLCDGLRGISAYLQTCTVGGKANQLKWSVLWRFLLCNCIRPTCSSLWPLSGLNKCRAPMISVITDSRTESLHWPIQTRPIVKHRIPWNLTLIRLKFCFCDKEECFCLGRTFLGSRQCVGPLLRHFKHFDPPPAWNFSLTPKYRVEQFFQTTSVNMMSISSIDMCVKTARCLRPMGKTRKTLCCAQSLLVKLA